MQTRRTQEARTPASPALSLLTWASFQPSKTYCKFLLPCPCTPLSATALVCAHSARHDLTHLQCTRAHSTLMILHTSKLLQGHDFHSEAREARAQRKTISTQPVVRSPASQASTPHAAPKERVSSHRRTLGPARACIHPPMLSVVQSRHLCNLSLSLSLSLSIRSARGA